MRKKTLKWILVLILSLTALYVVYDVHLKFVINDYQISKIEEGLKDNYVKHHKELDELARYAGQFSNFDLAINSSEELEISISNSSGKIEEEMWFFVEGDSIRMYDVRLEIEDLEQVILKSMLFDTLQIPVWRIEYTGEKYSSIASMILDSEGISGQNFQEIEERLDKVNSIGISKSEQRITIRYKGHTFDSFNYVYPLEASGYEPEGNYLSGNFYWEHYQFGLYCGWTNWGWL